MGDVTRDVTRDVMGAVQAGSGGVSPARLVNVHQAKTHLSQLLQQVERGEDVLIARSGVPVARLTAWSGAPPAVAPPGAMRGQIRLAADFDAPLEDLFEVLL